jgi:hypothetical protein
MGKGHHGKDKEMIYDTEYFKKIDEEETLQAKRLYDILNDMYAPWSVIDWGCATGLYLLPFVKTSYTVGIEIADAAIALAPPLLRIEKKDMTKETETTKCALAMCLEVIEHIDEQYEDIVIENITKSSDRLIISIAAEWQTGEGHVNSKPKEYWIRKFYDHGFIVNELDTTRIKEHMLNGYHLGWLTNNVMVLQRVKE